MAIRSNVKRTTPKRRPVSIPSRSRHAKCPPRAVDYTTAHLAPELKPSQAGVSPFSRAVRYLGSLSDYERLRIVRYTRQNFDLDRMRTLLKKLGNPQDQYKTVHVAGA